MLAKKPKDRPANMQEVFAAVRNLKFFKTDADEYAKLKASKKEADFSKSLSARLDSRVDAGRTDEEKACVAAEAKRLKDAARAMLEAAKKRVQKKGSSSTPAKPAAAAAPQPAAQVPMAPPGYGYPPGYPGQMMPGYAPMPGMHARDADASGCHARHADARNADARDADAGSADARDAARYDAAIPGAAPRPPLAPAPLPPASKVPDRKPEAPAPRRPKTFL